MRPVLPARHLVALVVEKADLRPERRLADGGRRLAMVLRHGDRRVGDLGRAVEDVEHVAEHLERLGRRGAGKLRAAAEDDPERRGVEAPRSAQRPSASVRWSIAGTTTADRCAVPLRCPRESFRRRSACDRSPCCRAERQRQVCEPERMEERRRDVGDLLVLTGTPVEHRAERVTIVPTSLRGAPLGVPVVPLVSMTTVGLVSPASTGVTGEAEIRSSSVACGAAGVAGVGPGAIVALGPRAAHARRTPHRR